MSKIVDLDNLVQDWKNTKIFGGTYGGFQRFDIYRHPIAKKLERTMRGAFWVPEEISMSDDKRNFSNLSEGHQKVFTTNLLFQTLADSLQSRGTEQFFAEKTTDPSWEAVFKTWAYFEEIHSLSYSHIIREVYSNPTKMFDDIKNQPEISKRFVNEVNCYNEDNIAEALIRVLALEGVKFYVSFLTTYSISEANKHALQGSVRINRLIQHDEELHTAITSQLIRIAREDPSEIGGDTNGYITTSSHAHRIFDNVAKQEYKWWKYISSISSIRGLSDQNVKQFIEYRVDKSLSMAGFSKLYNNEKPELATWFESFSSINNLVTAAQEAEALAYNTGTLENTWE